MIFEQLDTFIAFAVVMLLLSVLVMAFVQLVVAVLGLRGRNLRWGVERLLKEAAPETFKEDGGLDAGEVAHQVLTHPALGPARNWVALLLRWFLKKAKALEKIGRPSDGEGRARRGLRWILDRFGVFRNGRRPATTIRPEEVIRLLDGVRHEATAGSAVESELEAALRAESDDFIAESKKLAQQLEAQFPERAKALHEQIQAIGKKGGRLAREVENWFDTVMDATSERFKLWTRWITVAGALVLAFGFQVDSVSIFKQLSGDPTLRDAIVAQATAAQDLFEDLKAAAAAEEAVGAVPADAGSGGGSGGEVADDASGEAGGGAAGGEGEEVGGNGESTDSAAERVEAAKKGLEKARELVEATGLDLLDPLYPTWGAFWADFSRLLPFGEPPGMLPTKLRDGLSGKLMTVLLLSLGAPFWYSALSRMVGLRSVVAKKLTDRESAESG